MWNITIHYQSEVVLVLNMLFGIQGLPYLYGMPFENR